MWNTNNRAVLRLFFLCVCMTATYLNPGPATGDEALVEVFAGGEQFRLAAVQMLPDRALVFDREGAVLEVGLAEHRSITPEERDERGLGLAAGQRFVRSDDWSRLGRVSYRESADGGRTWSRLEFVGSPGSAVEVEGIASFHISDGGGKVVAVTQELHLGETARVHVFAADGAVLWELDAPHVRTVRLSRDGTRMLVLTAERLLFVDLNTGEARELPAAVDARISPNGQVVAIISGKEIQVFDKGTEAGRISTRGMALDLVFSSDGSTLAVADRRSLRVFHIESNSVEEAFEIPRKGNALPRSVELSEDGRVLIAGVFHKQRHPGVGREGKGIGTVLVFDEIGSLLLKTSFSCSLWNAATPDVRFADNGEWALVLDAQRVFVLNMK